MRDRFFKFVYYNADKFHKKNYNAKIYPYKAQRNTFKQYTRK